MIRVSENIDSFRVFLATLNDSTSLDSLELSISAIPPLLQFSIYHHLSLYFAQVVLKFSHGMGCAKILFFMAVDWGKFKQKHLFLSPCSFLRPLIIFCVGSSVGLA